MCLCESKKNDKTSCLELLQVRDSCGMSEGKEEIQDV